MIAPHEYERLLDRIRHLEQLPGPDLELRTTVESQEWQIEELFTRLEQVEAVTIEPVVTSMFESSTVSGSTTRAPRPDMRQAYQQNAPPPRTTGAAPPSVATSVRPPLHHTERSDGR